MAKVSCPHCGRGGVIEDFVKLSDTGGTQVACTRMCAYCQRSFTIIWSAIVNVTTDTREPLEVFGIGAHSDVAALTPSESPHAD